MTTGMDTVSASEAPAPAAREARPPNPAAIPRLRRGTLVYLESELRDYRATQRELRDREAEITEGGFGVAYDGNGTGGGGGGKHRSAAGHADPTGARATRLAQYTLLGQMRRVCAAIEGVLDLLPPEQRRALVLLYWHPRTQRRTAQVAAALNVDESTLRRWRRLWLTLLAARLGLH